MGRRTIYFTAAERDAAKRAQHANYAKSDRGKATRARLRAKHTQSLTVTSPTGIIIPPAARTRAAIYSVLSWSPWQDDVDVVADLGLCQSPYAFVLPHASAVAALLEVCKDGLELALNSIHCALIREEGCARAVAWSKEGLAKDFAAAAMAELGERVAAWNAVAAAGDSADEEGCIREVYLDWGAKRIVWLWEELEVRRKGRKAYLTARGNSELPTQRLYRANMDYLASLPPLEDSDEEHCDPDDLFSEMYD